MSQDFEFQVDQNGLAYYQDSVEVLNQDLDSAFIKISNWATQQVLAVTDTLKFSQSLESKMYLSKQASLNIENEIEYFVFTLEISMDNQLLKYKANQIYHYDPVNKSRCQNLGAKTGFCGFENDTEGWNQFQKEVDQYMNRLLTGIEDYLEAK